MNLLIELKWVVQAHETRSDMLGQLERWRGGKGCNCFLESSYATAGSGYYSVRWHEEVARFDFGFQMNTQIANNFCDEGLGTSLIILCRARVEVD